MGKSVVILGSQWGDEGKGKIVDLLTEDASAVVRFQGGNNAGHTLVVDNTRLALRLIPSGILRPHANCFLGNGVVVSPASLLEEITGLEKIGVNVRTRLRISEACPIVMPYHVALDKAWEQHRGGHPIGTTGRGIGPAYEDKIARRGLRLGDLAHPRRFSERLREVLDYHNFVLEHYFKQKPFDFSELSDEILAFADYIVPMLTDVPQTLADLRSQGSNILFEGAQGGYLDIDHGTYPYVTSSNTTAGAVATGSGVGPRFLDYILGITKAYTTRVGSGPFPTELHDSVDQHLRDVGREFGTVTGRPRRCGWFDAAAIRRSGYLSSLSALCITKLDVLDNLEELKIGVGYRSHGKELLTPPTDADLLRDCEVIYETLPGWKDSTSGITELDKLPANAKRYLNRLEELVEIPIDIISTGPDRKHTIVKRHPFFA